MYKYNYTCYTMLKEQSYKIPLSKYLSNCPQFYKNFEDYVRDNYPNDGIHLKFRSLLKEYNCRYYTGDGSVEMKEYETPEGLIFDTAEDALAFKLRWS